MSQRLSGLARVALLALAAAAAGAIGGRARASDDDRLLWGLGDEVYRFDLEEDTAARVAPEPGYALAFERIKLVGQPDFDRARRFKTEVRDLSDLLWFLVLTLPEGEFGARGGGAPVSDTFRLPRPQGDLVVSGRDEVSRKNGKTTAKVSVDFFQDRAGPDQQPWILKGSKMTVERTYDTKRKLVADARFEVTLRRTTGEGRDAVFRQSGRVALAGKVDANAKGFLVEVQGAIKRGTSFLQEALAKRLGHYKTLKTPPPQGLGYVALPTFALLRSGVPPAQLKDAFDYMAACEWRDVYSVSLYAMCLEARSIRREEVPAQAGGRTVARFRKEPIPKGDRAELLRAARWIAAVRKHGEGWWAYQGDPGRALDGPAPGSGTSEKKGGFNPADEGGPAGADHGDRSNSQFATLALHAAATSDCAVDPAVWKEVVDELVRCQETEGPAQTLRGVEWTAAAPPGIAPDGGADPFQPNATRTRDGLRKDYGDGARARGWGYGMREPRTGNGYGSMTGAGLSSAAIAREALRRAGKLDADADARTRAAIHDGVAWFVVHWSADSNPKNGGWYYYYLYSVEKAMETAGVERLGGHEWWREGCAQLLAYEDATPVKKGSWSQGNSEDTSFALLFLNRATLPATIVTQDQIRIASGERDPDAWDQVYVDGTGHVRLRQVFYAIETATPDLVKERLRIAEKGFEVLEEDRRPRLVPDLIRLLQLANKDVHRFAARALKIASGTEDEARARAFFARWQELARACEERDYGAIAAVRAVFKDAEAAHPLRRTACVALARLRAVEAVGDLMKELEDKDPSYRRQVATTIVQLLGGTKSPYDPAAADAERAGQLADWRAWWDANRDALVLDEEARRDVEALASGSAAAVAAAEARLKQLGRRAVRQLVDGLLEPRSKARAHALLRAITGQKLPAEARPWLDWWDRNKG